MKRYIAGMLIWAMLLLGMVGCGKQQQQVQEQEPEMSQMKAICELAVMECYYHNVAKFEQDGGKTFLFFDKKDTEFWIEYSGIVKLGVDISQVKLEVQDTVVTITLPKACVQSCQVDSATLSAENFIVAQGSAEVTAEQEIAAFDAAQTEMRKEAEGNTMLLAEAQQRAQSLLEDYVKNIGQVAGKEYTIRWIYPEAQQTAPADAGSGAEAAPETESIS